MAQIYPDYNVEDFVTLAGFMHEFCVEHSRSPYVHEYPTTKLQKLVFLNRANAGHNWDRGYLLEALIFSYLKTFGFQVTYDAREDVLGKIDLRVNGRPVQIKGGRMLTFSDFKHLGRAHLVHIPDFEGQLTEEHKDQILEVVCGFLYSK